jgi:C1A family cysteine protease
MTVKKHHKNYGWRPDLPDHRDHFAEHPPVEAGGLKVDLRGPGYPAVYDQGQLGSCTGNAIAGAMSMALVDEKDPIAGSFVPSRLFIYYGERVIEHSVGEDAGAAIRDGIKVVHQLGAPSEHTWPYQVAKFAHQPSPAAFAEALNHQATSYARVRRTLAAFRACLNAGFPFVLGFTVYDGFESVEVARTGVLNMPQPGEQVLGGHAVLCVGCDDATGRFLVRNSWGPDWGDHGHFTMPYEYLMHAGLSSDFWTIRFVEE